MIYPVAHQTSVGLKIWGAAEELGGRGGDWEHRFHGGGLGGRTRVQVL